MSKNIVARSIVIPLIAAQFWLSAAASDEQATPATPATTDPYLQCIANLGADPQFSDIAAKFPIRDVTAISFAMLADETRANPQERKEIGDWFDRSEECVKAGEALHRAQWPPELYQLAEEGRSGFKSIGVDLYNGKITFGEANKQIEQLGNTIKARMIPIVKQYQAEISARNLAVQQQRANEYAQEQTAATQAQAERLQRAQIFLNYMQAQQQQQQQLRNQFAPPPSYTTNCFTAGSNTNCTTH